MHDVLQRVRASLIEIPGQVRDLNASDEPASTAFESGSIPSVSRSDLADLASSLVDLIDANSLDELTTDDVRELSGTLQRLSYLKGLTIPSLWTAAAQTMPAYWITLDNVRRRLEHVLGKGPFLTQATEDARKAADESRAAAAALRKASSQVRAMEARLNDLQPRTTSLADMVARIEAAHEAADLLPTDLASLSEARYRIDKLLQDAAKDQLQVANSRAEVASIEQDLVQAQTDAKSVLERCETAYSAATSVGLAAAFTERSKSLSTSMWTWVGGLVIALAAGSFFGSAQLHSLAEIFKQPNLSTAVVILNVTLSLFSVGAPVWFAWLATKQIGQRFRLAEDYGFKASVARAYEGFRREAARVDKDLEARLLASALTRLDELPLRLVEPESHGSPWQELASSDVFKEAIRSVPGFAANVKDLAAQAINRFSPAARAATPAKEEQP